MKLFKLSLLALPLFVLVACGGGNEEGKKTIVDFIKEASDKSQESKKPIEKSIQDVFSGDYDRYQVILFEGYIGAIPSSITWSGGKMSVRIFERRNQTGGDYLSLDMPLGESENNVHQLPEEYKQSDLKVVTDDGKILGVGDKVRIKADGYYKSNSLSSNYYSMDVITVEEVEGDFDESVFEEAVPLTSDIIADTAVKSIYTYMDGTFSIPSVFFSMYGEIGLNFKTNTNKDIDKVDVMVGEGPSTMNSLPESYTSKNLVLRDFNGEELKGATKVRVYGVWERYSFQSSTGLNGKFKLEEIKKL